MDADRAPPGDLVGDLTVVTLFSAQASQHHHEPAQVPEEHGPEEGMHNFAPAKEVWAVVHGQKLGMGVSPVG